MLVKPSQLWSNLIKLGQTHFKLVLFGTGHYIIRWVLLQEFDLEIKDKKGSDNVIADHLSILEMNDGKEKK